MLRLFQALVVIGVVTILPSFVSAAATGAKISQKTRACLDCHSKVTPGIVSDWKQSRHSKIKVGEALLDDVLSRRVSAVGIDPEYSDIVVGCAECHTINDATHKDTFRHHGFDIHIVVTPPDCAVCHPVETEEYSKNIMAQAYGNLMHNPLYKDLEKNINGVHSFNGTSVEVQEPDGLTESDACLHCHGTIVEVDGNKERETVMGRMKFPVLTGWPNQGVGRINPDGSKGACTSCHPRHSFSIEVARKPATCSECHKGPDVPAYKVYSVSKHGNIYASLGKNWDFKAVPWTVGEDFTAPTCATCHASLVTDKEGNVLAKRTHQMNDRLSWRLFGLIYAHAHPKSADTSIISTKAGLPLPTELTGEPASEYLIDKAEQQKRRKTMQNICLGCHSTQWTDSFFTKLENTIKTTNAMTMVATQILLDAWDKGVAKGPADKDSLFNEAIEKMWVEQWLFYANSTRFAAAMGGADYGVFANGRWYMSKNISQMKDWLELLHSAGLKK